MNLILLYFSAALFETFVPSMVCFETCIFLNFLLHWYYIKKETQHHKSIFSHTVGTFTLQPPFVICIEIYENARKHNTKIKNYLSRSIPKSKRHCKCYCHSKSKLQHQSNKSLELKHFTSTQFNTST